MNTNDCLLSLIFYFSKGIGISNARKIFSLLGQDPQLFFSDGKKILESHYPHNSNIIEELFSEKNLQLSHREIELCKENSIDIIPFWDDDRFPKNLSCCSDSPILLFQKGNINYNSDKIISIVGTRNITSYGKMCIDNIIQSIKKYNPIIISGLAYGVDIGAHKTAIENDLQTIAILGHGFSTVYPYEHKKVLSQIFENGGAYSEFPFNTPPLRENFPRRNRIVAGISNATIVIESRNNGGSIITAKIANSYNRDVFAVPGKLNDLYSEGCNSLIKKNIANMITSGKDLEYILGWENNTKENKKILQQSLFQELSDKEKSILDVIEQNSKIPIDELSINLNMPTFKLAPILLELELKGAIECLPGNIYSLV